MDLKVRKFNDMIVGSCSVIRESCRALYRLQKSYSYRSPDRSEIDRQLVRISVASQRLTDLVFPLPSAYEIHGIPREAFQSEEEPNVLVVDRDHPQWDFMPWFKEKICRVQNAVNSLLGDFETDPEDLQLPQHLSITPEVYLAKRIRIHIAKIDSLVDNLLHMLQSGRLTVSKVRLVKEEEGA
jgi:hypothetical protein